MVSLGKRLAFSYKVKHSLTIDPAVPPLSIYLKESKIYVNTNISTLMSVTVSLVKKHNIPEQVNR